MADIGISFVEAQRVFDKMERPVLKRNLPDLRGIKIEVEGGSSHPITKYLKRDTFGTWKVKDVNKVSVPVWCVAPSDIEDLEKAAEAVERKFPDIFGLPERKALVSFARSYPEALRADKEREHGFLKKLAEAAGGSAT